MGHAVLSTAEHAGWRRFWDGWVICPDCMAAHGHTPQSWRVPPTYDDPIKPPYRCAECREEAPRDSGSDPQGENSRSEVEGEASQSGGEAASPTL